MTGSEQVRATCDIPRAERIARLNDRLRQTGQGGMITHTSGVAAIPGFTEMEMMCALASYDAFDIDNDPHGERDFGDIEIAGASVLWKIDYYDKDLLFASGDPADADVTERILLVMLPEEY